MKFGRDIVNYFLHDPLRQMKECNNIKVLNVHNKEYIIKINWTFIITPLNHKRQARLNFINIIYSFMTKKTLKLGQFIKYDGRNRIPN